MRAGPEQWPGEGFEIAGRFVEPAEVYPKSEAWELDGFTITDKEAAFAKLRELEVGSTLREFLEIAS